MSDYVVTAPDGKKYKVTGHGTAEEALQHVQEQFSGAGASAQQDQSYSGSLLPLSKDAEGSVSFDPNAGIVGSAKRAVTLPGEVMAGEVDPLSDEGIGRAAEMGVWATPGASGAASRLSPKKRVPVPSARELERVGGRELGRAERMGVDFDAGAIANWAWSTRADLERKIHPTRAEESFKLLDSLGTAPPGSVMEFRGLVAARRGFQDIAQSAKGQEKLAATLAIKEIDQFLASPPSGAVLAGPAQAASRTFERGRGNFAAGKRSNSINARTDSAELQAAVANAGRGSGNKIRAAAKWFADPLHPERLSDFSKGEAALIRNVAEGGRGRNTLRYVGNLLGGGGGLGGLVTGLGTGAVAGGMGGRPGVGALIGVTAPAVGAMARAADNRLTGGAMRRADEAVRMRSPLYQSRAQNAPMTPLTPQSRAAVRAAGAKGVVAPQLTPPQQRPITQEEYEAYLRGGGA